MRVSGNSDGKNPLIGASPDADRNWPVSFVSVIAPGFAGGPSRQRFASIAIPPTPRQSRGLWISHSAMYPPPSAVQFALPRRKGEGQPYPPANRRNRSWGSCTPAQRRRNLFRARPFREKRSARLDILDIPEDSSRQATNILPWLSRLPPVGPSGPYKHVAQPPPAG